MDGLAGGVASNADDAVHVRVDVERTRPMAFARARRAASAATSVWSAAWPTQRPSGRRSFEEHRRLVTDWRPRPSVPAPPRPARGARPPAASGSARRPGPSSGRPVSRAGRSSGRRGCPAKSIERMNARDRRQAPSSSVGKPTITSPWIATRGIAAGPARPPRRKRRVSTAGPSAAARRRRRTGAGGGRGAASAAPLPGPCLGVARRRRAAARSRRAGAVRLGLGRGCGGPVPRASGSRSCASPAEPPLGPAAVVRPDVDPGQDDLAMAGGERTADVGKDGLRGEATAPGRERPG